MSRRTGLPYVLTAHGSDVPGYNPDRFSLAHRLIGPFWRRILRGASAVTSPSAFLRDAIRAQIDIPVTIIPNGYDPPPEADVRRENRVIVVTRMFERKGVQFLIEAMRGAADGWSLHVVGDGPYLETLKEAARAAGIDATFHGYVQGAELDALYHSARIFSLPSISENFPVVLLEAMGAGCAVVTTSDTGCEEVVGPAGLCVAPGDPEALREALTGLMADDDEIARMRRRSLERSEEFRWPRIAARFEGLFRQFEAPGRSARTGSE